MPMVRNIHTRTVDAPAEAVGALLDRVSSEQDPIFPTPAWPPMRLDRPLGVGADGGHGRIRYRVSAYQPGLGARFDFTPPGNGYHELRVEPLGPARCRVRHVLEQHQRGRDRLRWLLAVRWIHDTVIEELFDNVERAATGAVRRPAHRSPWVRVLHRLTWDKAAAVPLPAAARLARAAFDRVDFSDAWQMALPPGMPQTPEEWRGVLRGASFAVRGRSDSELLLGADAGHLDIRASILVADGRVSLGTVVKIHNWRGRVYWAAVGRVHPFVARAMLRRIHRRLALAAPTAGERAWDTAHMRDGLKDATHAA